MITAEEAKDLLSIKTDSTLMEVAFTIKTMAKSTNCIYVNGLDILTIETLQRNDFIVEKAKLGGYRIEW